MNEQIFRAADERHLVVTDVEGALPDGLRGTLLAALPGQQQVGPDTLNFFDGHALIAGLSFPDLVFRGRFVDSKLRRDETAAGRMTKRRLFTNLPSRWRNLFGLDLGNPVMHDVYAWGGRVVASNDPGHLALDAETLATIGAERWGGAVEKGVDTAPMPYRDPATGHLVGWLKRNGGTKPDALRFVELDDDFALVASTAEHRLAASPSVVHDQRALPDWYVVTEAGGRLSALSALWGAATIWDSLRWAEDCALLLAPRGRDGGLVRVALPGIKIAFHFVNAFQDGDHVVADLVTYDRALPFSAAASAAHRAKVGVEAHQGPVPVVRRFRVDPRAGALVSADVLTPVPMEAPEVADAVMGRPYRVAWSATPAEGGGADRGFYPSWEDLVRVDVETGEARRWSAGAQATVSPPAFVPTGDGEDVGHLLAWVVDGDGASVVVLDATTMGLAARVRIGAHLPGVSHVRFAPDIVLAGPPT